MESCFDGIIGIITQHHTYCAIKFNELCCCCWKSSNFKRNPAETTIWNPTTASPFCYDIMKFDKCSRMNWSIDKFGISISISKCFLTKDCGPLSCGLIDFFSPAINHQQRDTHVWNVLQELWVWIETFVGQFIQHYMQLVHTLPIIINNQFTSLSSNPLMRI